MVGYICVSEDSSVRNNCYLADMIDDKNVSCQDCKIGYGVYYGLCVPLKSIMEGDNYTVE